MQWAVTWVKFNEKRVMSKRNFMTFFFYIDSHKQIKLKIRNCSYEKSTWRRKAVRLVLLTVFRSFYDRHWISKFEYFCIKSFNKLTILSFIISHHQVFIEVVRKINKKKFGEPQESLSSYVNKLMCLFG